MLALGASYETENFVIQNAPTPELAREFGETAESCRHDLAMLWLGRPLPDWSGKCPIKVTVGDLGAGGATTFIFQGGEVYGWEMDIQGSARRIVDSVLPHEITHMIFASHLRAPVPRWLDEGAATSVEHESEKANYRKMLRRFITPEEGRCLPFNRMVSMKEYPSDVMPFYAQGFSVVEYLIALGGHRELIRFAETGMKAGNWNAAVREHYGFENLGQLQNDYWLQWVAAGSPGTLAPNLQPQTNLIASTRGTLPSTILPVSAEVPPRYGRNAVTAIPSSFASQATEVIPIPSVYERLPQAVPAATTEPDSLDQWIGIEQTVSRPEPLIDSISTRTVYR